MTRRAAAAALVLLLAGCAMRSRHQPTPGTEEGEWAALRDGATRRDRLYDLFDHRATATATYLSPAVRDARARRLGEWKSWTEDELARALEAERADGARGEEFLLAFYTADTRVNDLDAVGSAWRVALRTDAGEARAEEIRALDGRDPDVKMLFPWVGPFDVVYRVRFPHAQAPLDGAPFVVEIASALGQLELDWALPPVKTPLLLPAPPERR